jgi:CheY-like chemotaxis protein
VGGYEGFASRDLAEFDVVYLLVDGIAERLHLGQPREAVLAAWGILADGKKALLHLAPGTKEDTASCREFFQDLRRRGLSMPGRDGIELMAQLATRNYAGRIVLMSGSDERLMQMSGTIAKARGLAVEGFLSKLFRKQRLQELLISLAPSTRPSC